MKDRILNVILALCLLVASPLVGWKLGEYGLVELPPSVVRAMDVVCPVGVIGCQPSGGGGSSALTSSTVVTGFVDGCELFNNNGALGCDTDLSWNLTTNVLTNTGRFRAGAGTAADPSFRVGTSNMGLYEANINQLGFAAGGVEVGQMSGSSWFPVGNGTVSLGIAGSRNFLHLFLSGYVRYMSTTPAVSNTSANSCGTTAATIAGANEVGIVTVGATSGTSCTLTFSIAAPTRRVCSANNESTAALVRFHYTSTTVGELVGVFTAGDVINYECSVY